jgi:tRNA (guanosine-2'-O-)-methyltransferase
MGKDLAAFADRSLSREEKFRHVLGKRQPTLTIVLENVHDPHNIAAVLRSCDAVGVIEICAVYHSRQHFPNLGNLSEIEKGIIARKLGGSVKKLSGKKSSAGTRKWLEIRRFGSIEECYQALRAEGKKIYSTYFSASSVSLYSLNLIQPVALVFGNEQDGVTAHAAELADGNFLIPQFGMGQSLNISVACAVSMFEACRQRLEAGMYAVPQLSDSVFQSMLDEWLSR